ncbi:MAG: hypothetical protein IJU64_06600 [Bacilli bacterium]|nr:hypothetical protein [Bacilli bacterium]
MEESRDKKLYAKYTAKMRSIIKDEDEAELYAGLSRGKNSYLRLDRVETSSFDARWIDKIEGVIFDLGDIIKAPRSVTHAVSDITPIELAKKITGESVQHLASHTQYIKEVDEYGNVIPSKILNFSNEDNLFTYENRFIATFIRKLMLFVEKRYEFALKFAKLHDEEVLYLKNHSQIGDSEISIETKVKVKSVSHTEVSQLNSTYFQRIAEIRNYILYYYNSPFMRKFKTENNVRNPILQTNIIRKNPKYHHCYEVYRYLETYSTLGITYRMNEDYSVFTDKELAELNFSLLGSYLALQGKDKSTVTKGAVKEYKPKILTHAEDEAFIYGPYLKGPIHFVRADEGYMEYLNRLLNKDLPLHPTRKEKEYYAEEYEEKRDLREFEKELEQLRHRNAKMERQFEKQAEAILEKREFERKRLAAKEAKVIQQEETDLLNRVRAELVAAAKATWNQSWDEEQPVSKKGKKQKQEEPILEEQQPEPEEYIPASVETAEEAPEVSESEAFVPEEVAPKDSAPKDSAPEARASEEVVPQEQGPVAQEEVPIAPVEKPKASKPAAKKGRKRKSKEPEIDETPAVLAEPETPEPEISEPLIEEALPEEPIEEAAVEEKEEASPAFVPVFDHQTDAEAENYESPKYDDEDEEEFVPVKQRKPKMEREPIPGTFIVKTLMGYYVEEGTYSEDKDDAKVFDDYNLAHDIKAKLGGKVVKL